MVRDLPFASANVTTNVVITPKDPRCATETLKVVQKKTTLVEPETLTFVKLDLAPQFRYKIQADLVLPIELPGLESTTIREYVTLEDYWLIDACNEQAISS